MKDVTHHLKHVQRKVIQSARKEEQSIKSNSVSIQYEERVPEKRESVNRRIINNRLPGFTGRH